MSDINGILVVDKPSGWTSHDVVKKTKFLLGGLKVGHTGTLDPFATGVLVLLIGKATKLAQYFEKDDKTYQAEITFGYSTDTYDISGEITAKGNPDKLDSENLMAAIKSFEGESEQIPPMYSSVKVKGKRLYQLARAGEIVERKSRKITIYSIEIVHIDFPIITLSIACSKGTYIRSIANQIGDMVYCPAHLSALRRTASGKYTLKDAACFLSLVNSTNRSEIEHLIIPIEKLPYYENI